MAKSAGSAEYTDCISAEGYDSNNCPGFYIKTDGEARIMLEFWEMRIIPSLPSLPGRFWPGVVATDRVLFMGQIELN